MAISNGVGLFMNQLTLAEVMSCLKALFFVELAYCCALYFIKISILFCFLRLSTALKDKLYRPTLIWMVVMTLQFLATIITVCLQCRPITYFWNKGQPGTCIDTTSFTYFQNAYTIFSDIVIIILPLPFLLEVNRATSQKIALATVFMIGILSTIASCVRLSTVRAFALAKDPIYDVAPIILWSHIEIHLGVICACAPVHGAHLVVKKGLPTEESWALLLRQGLARLYNI
ncbi:hypothetical protein BP5796_05745 [Coleophoma crateriformis]|uniref:Rhodopsin domain-containing protein n=1 Tax=Coleophoma crateriformis TaxID=565419 RepID=A0A3D8RV12_9HELO|nr:hypothetical protein BP5796_05745 [Coleophoma crateriformis]